MNTEDDLSNTGKALSPLAGADRCARSTRSGYSIDAVGVGTSTGP